VSAWYGLGVQSCWSINTTLRNPERVLDFARCAEPFVGRRWDNETQRAYFLELIRRGSYEPSSGSLDKGRREIVGAIDPDDPETFLDDETLEDVAAHLNYANAVYGADQGKILAFRGRTAFAPLTGFGLFRHQDGLLALTATGQDILHLDVTLRESIWLQIMAKWQATSKGLNIRPFISTLAIIDGVNTEWGRLGHKPVGISRDEFSFVLTTVDCVDVESAIGKIIDLRLRVKSGAKHQKDKLRERLLADHIREAFPGATDPVKFEKARHNLRDYADSAIRYFRFTGMLFLRGNGRYVDISPQKEDEKVELLTTLTPQPQRFASEDAYIDYLSSPNAITFQWESKENLLKKNGEILTALSGSISSSQTQSLQAVAADDTMTMKQKNASLIQILRQLNATIAKEDIPALIEAIRELSLAKNKKTFSYYPEVSKPSIRLEWITTLTLSALGKPGSVKPNYTVGDDGIPLWTAGGGQGDIEVVYDPCNLLVEVTMLRGRDQYYAELQPVLRHIAEYMDAHDKPVHGLFIAPTIHRDTVNHFYSYQFTEYEEKIVAVLPLVLDQLAAILEHALKNSRLGDERLLLAFMEDASKMTLTKKPPSNAWLDEIQTVLNSSLAMLPAP